MKLVTKSVLLITLILISGCTAVRMKQPLSPASTVPNKELYEGVWQVNDGSIILQFDSSGIGRFASVEWKEGNFELEKGQLIITHCEFGDYLSVREEGEDSNLEYLLAECKLTDEGYLVVWTANPEFFAAAVKKRKLEGTVTRSELALGKAAINEDVTLEGAPEKILQFLEKHATEMAFLYKEPMIFKRLSQIDQAQSVTPEKSQPDTTPSTQQTTP